MADQEGVAAGAHPVAPDLRQHVMRHVLLVPELRAAGRRAGDRRRDLPPVRLVVAKHLVAHRVFDAGERQIGGIERLVGDGAVRRLPKARISAVERLRGPDHMAIRTESSRAAII